ncbi:TIR domain-containing protein [Bacillus gobiensis]|uniref:TIR domain-containing protein n=1 Tax=Bacillus gobiensis TaxID=1441095 RepID=UPI003D256D6B
MTNSTFVFCPIINFYDDYEKSSLWGKDLYTHLQDVYFQEAKYTIMFISSHYAQKLWTNHERKNAQARAFQENKDYILPARFDDTEIPGLLPTIGYIDLRELEPMKFGELIIEKLENDKQLNGTSISSLLDSELKEEAEAIINGIRKLLTEYWKEQDKFLILRLQGNDTEEDSEKKWHEINNLLILSSSRLMESYNKLYKVKAIITKDELLNRLPKTDRAKHRDSSYVHPTNPLGIESVIDDLEHLTKLLKI